MTHLAMQRVHKNGGKDRMVTQNATPGADIGNDGHVAISNTMQATPMGTDHARKARKKLFENVKGRLM